jgi:hypothetical protein
MCPLSSLEIGGSLLQSPVQTKVTVDAKTHKRRVSMGDLLANVLNPKEREIAEVAFVHTFKKQDVQRTHSIQTLTLSLKSMKRGFYVTFWRVPQKCKKKVNDSFQLNFAGPSGKKENEFLCCFGSCI